MALEDAVPLADQVSKVDGVPAAFLRAYEDIICHLRAAPHPVDISAIRYGVYHATGVLRDLRITSQPRGRKHCTTPSAGFGAAGAD